jgi:hypothetical protein
VHLTLGNLETHLLKDLTGGFFNRNRPDCGWDLRFTLLLEFSNIPSCPGLCEVIKNALDSLTLIRWMNMLVSSWQTSV